MAPTVPAVALVGDRAPTGERLFQADPQPILLRDSELEGVFVGDLGDIAREGQHHRDHWRWFFRAGLHPPVELQPG